MKYRVKPERVHIIVFCFFLLAAGCRGVSDFAFERLASASAGQQQVEQHHAVNLEAAHICAIGDENCADPEILFSPDLRSMDIGYPQP